MLIRIRSAFGTIRCDVQDKDDLSVLREKVTERTKELAQYDWYLSFDSRGREDIFRSPLAIAPVGDWPLHQGDMLFAHCRAVLPPRPHTTTAASEIKLAVSALNLGSHAGIYAIIRRYMGERP